MPCHHGTSESPVVRDFENDTQLRIFLGLPDTERGRAAVAKLSPKERLTYAEMRAVADELKAGRIPRGVIACDRVGRTVR